MRKILLSCLAAALAFSANAQQHQYVTPIDSVQYVDPAELAAGNDQSTYFNRWDTVTVEGIVTFDPGYYGLSTNRKAAWIQTSDTGKWKGLHIMVDPAPLKNQTGITKTLAELLDDTKFYENFVPGLKVKVTGIIDEFQNYTQLVLLPIESEIVDLNINKIKPQVLPVSTFMKLDQNGEQKRQLVTGEPYENMYVEFRNVSVVDVSPGSGNRWFWSVQDENGNKIQIRDASGYYRNDANAVKITSGHSFTPPPIGTKLNYIRGVIFQADVSGVNQYFIAPLTPEDIDIQYIAPSVISVWRNPSVAGSADAVTVYAQITDDKDSVMSATLYYAVGSVNATLQNVSMTKTTNNVWLAQIPAQSNNSIVFYWIKATDNDNQSIYAPDSFKTGYRYMVLNGGITKISQIQEDPFAKGPSIWNRDTVDMSLKVVVTSAINEKDLGQVTVQDATTPFSGITIKGNSNVTLANLKRGDSLRITRALVREDFNVTVLENTNITVLSSGNAVPDPVKGISPDSIMAAKYNYAEAYESMLLEFNDVYVVDTNADHSTNRYFGEWAIGFDTMTYTGLRVDDISMDIPDNFARDSLKMHQKLNYIRGIVTYSFGNWKLFPRNRSDIYGFKTPEVVGVKEMEKTQTAFSMYPNPAQNSIYIVPQKSLNNGLLQVTDIQGKVILERAIYAADTKLAVNVSNLPNGLYLVKVSDKLSVNVQKLLIQK